MSKQHIQILRYMWAGLRLTENGVVAPNGCLVQRIRYQTLMDLLRNKWVEPDPSKETHFRLTSEGQARALVKVRVEDFLNDLTNHQTA